jgi:hypothetical protein
MIRRTGFFRSSTILPFLVLILIPPAGVLARSWDVGPGRSYSAPSQVAGLVGHGDTVNIAAGEYVDCATWTRNDLLLRGVGGYAHLRDKACGGKAIWIIQGNNTTVENIEFSGATVVDKNGAGIRQEGANLTIRHCFFHDNEDGILAGDNAGSVILIENCEFARNGYGDGYSHNMYINHVARFTLRYCYVHHAKIGHEVKSRAYQTFILYNRISDEGDGTASRCIDLPNGGLSVMMGNVIHHGPAAQNSNVLGYGLEGLTNPVHTLILVNNTFVTEKKMGPIIQVPASGNDTVYHWNNLYVPDATTLAGKPTLLAGEGNVITTGIPMAGFLNAGTYDYHLLGGAPAIDKGVDPGSFNGIDLHATEEYVHPVSRRPRNVIGAIDAGAFEFDPANDVETPALAEGITLSEPFPNPSTGAVTIVYSLPSEAGTRVRLRVLDLMGRERIATEDRFASPGAHRVSFDAQRRGLASGTYFIELVSGNIRLTKRLFLLR